MPNQSFNLMVIISDARFWSLSFCLDYLSQIPTKYKNQGQSWNLLILKLSLLFSLYNHKCLSVHPSVSLSVSQQNPSTAWIFILHHSTFIFHHSTFILHHLHHLRKNWLRFSRLKTKPKIQNHSVTFLCGCSGTP